VAGCNFRFAGHSLLTADKRGKESPKDGHYPDRKQFFLYDVMHNFFIALPSK
jgi:hypothetical protein